MRDFPLSGLSAMMRDVDAESPPKTETTKTKWRRGFPVTEPRHRRSHLLGAFREPLLKFSRVGLWGKCVLVLGAALTELPRCDGEL